MEAAAQAQSSLRGQAVAPQIDAAPVGTEARRKRTKTLRQPPQSGDHNHRGDLDDSNKRAPNVDPNWRDWAALGDRPARLIAERLLAYDVADYLRFRAVCKPWRESSTKPREHSCLDRRFHPRRWTMLLDELASSPPAPPARCFLNTSTAECVKVDIPELGDYKLLARTPEGLLLLLRKGQGATVRLLNPLTRQHIDLPPLTTLLPSEKHHLLSEDYTPYVYEELTAWGSGIAKDNSTFVLCLNKHLLVGMAKPSDDRWNLLDYHAIQAPIMFEGNFYCLRNKDGVIMVLDMGADQPPQLKVAVNERLPTKLTAVAVHLVNNCGELMLLHRPGGTVPRLAKSYDLYRVDLVKRRLEQFCSLGRKAVFMGLYCSLSVPVDVFPSGSLRADTIYLRHDIRESKETIDGAYHLAGKRGKRFIPALSLVPRPHTLIDCISLSNTE